VIGRHKGWLSLIAVGIAVALGVTLFSPFASGSPDGLEKVAEQEGFLEEADEPSYNFIADYAFPGVADERLATVLAGVAGVLIVAALGLAVGYGPRLLRSAQDRDDAGVAPGGAGKAANS
jgi:hypothetical protein